MIRVISGEYRGLEVFEEGLWRILLLVGLVEFDPAPRLQPELHLLQTYKVVLAHRQLPTYQVNLVLLQVLGLPQANSHLVEGHHALALDFVERFRLPLLLYQFYQLLYLTLSQLRKVLLLKVLQLLDVLYFLAQQQNCQADDFFVNRVLQRYSTVFFQPHGGNVLEGLDARRVDIIEEAGEVHLLFVSIESKENLEFFVGVAETVFLQEHEDTLAGDDSFCACDVVKECEGMEVGAGGESFAIGLEGVLLVFEECEVAAYAAEDVVLFELWLFGAAVPLHNDYRTNYQYH